MVTKKPPGKKIKVRGNVSEYSVHGIRMEVMLVHNVYTMAGPLILIVCSWYTYVGDVSVQCL